MLKEVRERHEKVPMRDGKPAYCGINLFNEAHQDRAYLLGLVEEAKDILEDIIFYCDPAGWQEMDRAKDFLTKLESEGGE